MLARQAATAFVLIGLVGSPAWAGNPVVQPVQVGAETVRYDRGVATVDLQRPHGAVQITPLPMDHGGLAFSVAVLNGGDRPANIDITNFSVRAGSQSLPVFSRVQLEKKAKNRAMWAQIALAAVGGIGAAAAASQRDYYHSSLVTPRGTYRATYSAPSAAGQVAGAAIAAGTGVAIASIQNNLDRTREILGETTIQLTTVDPQESYAGRIVVAKIKKPTSPQRVDLMVSWNGENYPFAFQLAKEGTPAPVFTALSPPSVPVNGPTAASTEPQVSAPTS